jgi:uncharacterized membrane protein YdjX (TVP38/TMEM64 family)
MRRLLPLALIALVGGLFAIGAELRGEFDFEISTGSVAEVQASLREVRSWVLDLGWIAPAIFVGMVTFRYFLFLPSALVLSAGGLAFGAPLGTLLGVVGIVLSALVHFCIGRFAGRDLLQSWFGREFGALNARVERLGLWVVGLGTAHPAGTMGILHVAAGFTSISIFGFLAAVAAAAPLRAGAYAFLGATLVEMEWWVSALVAAGMLLAVILPLLHPGARARLLGHSRSGAQSP